MGNSDYKDEKREIEINEKGKIIFVKKDSSSRCKNSMTPRVLEHSLCFRLMMKSNPKDQYRWLDLACGDGTLFKNSGDIFDSCIKKITYLGTDQNIDKIKKSINEELRKQNSINMNASCIEMDMISPLGEYEKVPWGEFDWVSLINAFHEIEISTLSNTLISMVKFCNDKGSIYIRDVEEYNCDNVIFYWKGVQIENIMKKCFGFSEIIRVSIKSDNKGEAIPVFIIIANLKDMQNKIDFCQKQEVMDLKRMIDKELLKSIKETYKDKYGLLSEVLKKLSKARKLDKIEGYLKEIIPLDIGK